MRVWMMCVLLSTLALAQPTDIVQRTYRCAGGVQVRAVYQNQFDRVGVVFNNQTYGPLFQVAAASGASIPMAGLRGGPKAVGPPRKPS